MSAKTLQRLSIIIPLGAVLLAGAEVAYQYARCASLQRQIRIEMSRHRSAPDRPVSAHEGVHS
jgi:hypothetical protein